MRLLMLFSLSDPEGIVNPKLSQLVFPGAQRATVKALAREGVSSHWQNPPMEAL